MLELAAGRCIIGSVSRSGLHHAFAGSILALLLSGRTIGALGPDLARPQRWVEYPGNPVFVAPPELGYATFPTVLYDANRFGRMDGPFYKLWFDSARGLFYADSLDGRVWEHIRPGGAGLRNPMQGKILYDARCFGRPPFAYRIWYADSKQAPNGPLRTASSTDGLEWTDDQEAPGVYLPEHKWSRRGYGVIAVLHHSGAAKEVNPYEPLGNRFLLFYECFILTGKGMCEIALAVSGDGVHFRIVGDGPVIPCGGRDRKLWDADYATFGSILEYGGKLHAWYSGGRDENVDLLFSGVGYAVSDDGLRWQKAAFNPVVSWKDVQWRWGTCSMPQVLCDPARFSATGERNGPIFKMFLCGSENSKFFTTDWRVNVGVLKLAD